MNKKDFIKYFAAGIFFIAGIILILALVFTIGRDKGFAQPKFQMSLLFKNIGGLAEGAPVRLSGVDVGNVARIGFLDHEIDGRTVNVTINVFKKYKDQLRKKARYVIKTEGILGEKIIGIYVVEERPSVNLNQPLAGEDPFDVQDLAEVFADAAHSFTRTSRELSKIDIIEFTRVTEESARAMSMTARDLNDVMDELKEISGKFKRILNRVEERLIDGTLFKVF